MAQWFNPSFFTYFPYFLQRKYLVPQRMMNSFLDLDIEDLKKRGKKLVIADLDNTIAVPSALEVSAGVREKVQRVKDAGISFAILSNHAGNIHDDHASRYKAFTNSLGVDIIPIKYKKPDKRAYLIYLERYHVKACDAVCIGDRILTDIVGANILGIESILVQPLDPAKDPWFVKLSRKLERILLKLYR